MSNKQKAACIFMLIFSIAVCATSLFSNSESSNLKNIQSISVWELRANQTADYPVEQQIKDMQKLAFIPSIETIQLTYDVKTSYYQKWNPGNNHVVKGMTLQEQKDWIDNQTTPRSQDLVIIITITPEGWGCEYIAQPGDIFPLGRHQKVFYNFNKREIEAGIYIPETHEETKQFEPHTFNSFKMAIYAYRTPSELLGIYDHLPFYIGSNMFRQDTTSVDGITTKRIINSQTGNIISEAEISSTSNDLMNAVYYEGPYIAREIELSDYQFISSIEKSIPHTFNFKRYNCTILNNRSEDTLIESNEYSLVSVETDF